MLPSMFYLASFNFQYIFQIPNPFKPFIMSDQSPVTPTILPGASLVSEHQGFQINKLDGYPYNQVTLTRSCVNHNLPQPPVVSPTLSAGLPGDPSKLKPTGEPQLVEYMDTSSGATDLVSKGQQKQTHSSQNNDTIDPRVHTSKDLSTNSQSRLINRPPVGLEHQGRKHPKYIGLSLQMKAQLLINRASKASKGEMEIGLPALPPIVKPDSNRIRVDLVGKARPPSGSCYNANVSRTGSILLSEATKIQPSKGNCNSNLPDFDESILNTQKGIWTNIIRGRDTPIELGDNEFSFTSSVNINHAKLVGRIASLIRTNEPILFVLGDESVPELLDDGNRMVVVLRGDGACFETLKVLILRVFKNKSRPKGAGLVPQGSMVLVCLPGLLCKLGQVAFNSQFEYFDSWIINYLATGVNIDNAPAPNNKTVKKNGLICLPICNPSNVSWLKKMSALQNTVSVCKLAKFVPPPPANPPPTNAVDPALYLNYEHLIMSPAAACEKKNQCFQGRHYF